MNALLMIDFQKDFIDKSSLLCVSGATKDVFNTTGFLSKHKIDHLIVTMDFHPFLHIGNAKFWKNNKGEHPAPFTNITYHDVLNSIWIPCRDEDFILECLANLDDQKKFVTIWPTHCVAGTDGANLHSEIQRAIQNWEIQNSKTSDFVLKGRNWFEEEYGAFDIVNDEKNLIAEKIVECENIYITGEAYTHCVKETVIGLLDDFPQIKYNQIVMLTNCMSSIPGIDMTRFETKMKAYGVRFMDTSEIQ